MNPGLFTSWLTGDDLEITVDPPKHGSIEQSTGFTGFIGCLYFKKVTVTKKSYSLFVVSKMFRFFPLYKPLAAVNVQRTDHK